MQINEIDARRSVAVHRRLADSRTQLRLSRMVRLRQDCGIEDVAALDVRGFDMITLALEPLSPEASVHHVGVMLSGEGRIAKMSLQGDPRLVTVAQFLVGLCSVFLRSALAL